MNDHNGEKVMGLVVFCLSVCLLICPVSSIANPKRSIASKLDIVCFLLSGGGVKHYTLANQNSQETKADCFRHRAGSMNRFLLSILFLGRGVHPLPLARPPACCQVLRTTFFSFFLLLFFFSLNTNDRSTAMTDTA
ncbi:hypothetical protein QBC45DRAFT_407156 [Copromyces sp. CBS 386.78]|nr:hypothetical protein QBC45DRAFT_407156 [Copromyces sp. CBS 386.78]